MMQKPSEMKAQTLGILCTFVWGSKEEYPTNHVEMDRMEGTDAMVTTQGEAGKDPSC